MESNPQAPVSLKIVAVLFIIIGLSSILNSVVDLMSGHITIGLGLLGLFVGWGLLRLRRGWRACALVMLWGALIGTPIVAVVAIVGYQGPLSIEYLGKDVEHWPKAFIPATAVAVFALSLWGCRVLARSDVCQLFGADNQ